MVVVRLIRAAVKEACDGTPKLGGSSFSMVDQKSTTYRPRRAFIEPDVEPAKPEQQPAGPDRDNFVHPRGTPIPPPVVDEDHPKPLYRDETRTNGWSSPAARAAAAPEADPPTDESVRPITSAPQRGLDEETTAILPRSRQGQQRSHTPLDAIHDYDEDERMPLGRRTKVALLIGGVAVVVVIGLLVGYAVLSAGSQRQSQSGAARSPAGSGTSGGGTSANTSQPPDQTGTASLSDASMLNPAQAENLDSKRTWKVELTQRNPAEDAPTAACFGGEPLDGQPTPQQKILRALTSSGKNGPTALHEAMSYNSPDEAIQAFAIASRTLGGCAVTGSYIESGRSVTGVGNQSVGAVIKVVDGSKSQAHSIVLNRTGRVMNVVDAVQPSQALAITAVAKALQQVNTVQCGPAGGECGGTLSIKDGPPPLGGDKPGFLATGDLPPAGPKMAPWVATEIEPPTEEFKGSACENVNWETVAAESKDARTYLIQDTGTNFFGLDEIVLTTKDAKAAKKQVERIKSSLTACKNRQPTATVTTKKVTSIGAKNAKVTGWTAVVSQKSIDGTHKYRVGIVSAGPKVIYTFLNPKDDYDFSGGQWDTVAVRAGERATQVNP
jgi:hypothetical protein